MFQLSTTRGSVGSISFLGCDRGLEWFSEGNPFKGYSVENNNCEVSLLKYTDDTIFLSEVNVKNVFTIKVILRLFELVYGLRVSFHKSSFGAIGVEFSLCPLPT